MWAFQLRLCLVWIGFCCCILQFNHVHIRRLWHFYCFKFLFMLWHKKQENREIIRYDLYLFSDTRNILAGWNCSPSPGLNTSVLYMAVRRVVFRGRWGLLGLWRSELGRADIWIMLEWLSWWFLLSVCERGRAARRWDYGSVTIRISCALNK